MNIVEKGYKIFQKYHVSKIENACTFCCLNKEEVNQLLSLNLREIPVDLLSTYNDSAQATDPEIQEFKHFLPRYLDLIFEFEFPSHSSELSLKNMANYEVTQWTEEEWEFLNEFTLIFFKKCLATHPIPNTITGMSEVLIMLDKAGFDFFPFLELWENNNDVQGSLHYKDLLVSDFNWMKKTKLSNPFSSKEISDALYNWSNQKEVRLKNLKRMEEIILGDFKMEDHDLNELNWLYDFLALDI